jgi:Ca-activated chloride channel family protein
MTAANAASDLGIKIYTIGAAIPGGGLIPVDDPTFGRRLVKMEEDLNENDLLEIARIGHAKYFRVTSGKRFREIYDEIDKMEKTKIEIEMIAEHKDAYLPLLLVSLIVLISAILLECTVYRTVP